MLAALAGVLMAVGLGVADLTDPGRIIAFLDFTGAWDPTALFVMASAAGMFAIGYRVHAALSSRLGRTVQGGPSPVLPQGLDRSLILGALIFGVGWGLSGLCPGPALTALAGGGPPIVFVIGMTSGMVLHSLFAWRAATSLELPCTQRRPA